MPGLMDKYVKSGRFLRILFRDERVLSVLNAHLLCEEVLRDYLERLAAHPQMLDRARLTFSQYLSLTRALCARAEANAWEWAAVNKLNKLRNTIAHGLPDEGVSETIADYVKFVWAHDDRLGNVAEKMGQTSNVDEATAAGTSSVAGLLDITSSGLLLSLCALLDDHRTSALAEQLGVPLQI